MKNIQAFPLQTKIASGLGGVLDKEGSLEMGMTLLDYFAGQFLSSIAVAVSRDDYYRKEEICQDCYNIAEVMLKEREKRL